MRELPFLIGIVLVVAASFFVGWRVQRSYQNKLGKKVYIASALASVATFVVICFLLLVVAAQFGQFER